MTIHLIIYDSYLRFFVQCYPKIISKITKNLIRAHLYGSKVFKIKGKSLTLHRKIEFNNLKSKKMSQETANRVKAIIVDKLGVDENEVTETANFTQDLGADSLDTVELIMEFEKEFGITIPDEEAQKIATVADAIAFIEAANN